MSLMLCDRKPHALVVDVDESGQRLQCIANRGLFAHDQRHRSEIGKRAAVGHHQAELLGAGLAGGRLQQAADRGDRYPHVRALEALQRQADLAQHGAGIEPYGARDVGIMGEGRTADQDCSWRVCARVSRNVQ